MKDIGSILKAARERKHLTQQKVMDLTGIHRKSLSGYENNVAQPDLATFATLIVLYGLSADTVLEIKPDPSDIFLDPFDEQILSCFHNLDEQHQKEFMVQLSALVKYLNNKKGTTLKY